jgi:hypothetical protein
LLEFAQENIRKTHANQRMKFILVDGTLSSLEILEMRHALEFALTGLDDEILIGFGIFSTYTLIYEIGTKKPHPFAQFDLLFIR